jgi:hypothetical protein
MQHRVAAFFLVAFVSTPFHIATAAGLPEIKINPANTVPECVTPGRLLAFLKSRNSEFSPQFESVPAEYMRQGELLGVRWDFAFYQMILETGALSYKRGNRNGDVKPAQNNFAGLGATGRGEHGESFKDIPTGVRAHLEHLLLYSGEKLENPTAERTRKVQEWGVLTKWQSGFTKPITFADLAAQWAPGSGTYARMLDGIAERFVEFCEQPDPRPEMATQVRRELKLAAARAQQPSGAELAKRAIETGKTEQYERRQALGVQQETPAQKPLAMQQPFATQQPIETQSAKAPPVGYKVLNSREPDPQAADAPLANQIPKAGAVDLGTAAEAPGRAKERDAKAKTAAPATAPAATTPKTAATDKPSFQVASAAGAAKQIVSPPPAVSQKCRVWTASYGGQKALIIRSVIDKVVNYTVLDVNEGAENREAEAFISAYAKDGAIAGEFVSQTQALDKAFELCPEG